MLKVMKGDFLNKNIAALLPSLTSFSYSKVNKSIFEDCGNNSQDRTKYSCEFYEISKNTFF